MICKAYLVAEAIDIKALPSLRKLREVSYVKVQDNIFVIFPFGVVVCWGDGNLADVLVLIQAHMTGPLASNKMIIDEFEVNTNPENMTKLVFEDCINIEEIDELILIAISHPIAQSLRLMHFEETILDSIQRVKHIPECLAKHGKIFESKNKISKMQGHLYVLKGQINFEHSILDKPEFFWEYPEYDHFYNKMSDYLEVTQRIGVLNKKMATIDETLSILSDELNHRHSSKLEWIIIILIFIEILFFLLKDIFKII